MGGVKSILIPFLLQYLLLNLHGIVSYRMLNLKLLLDSAYRFGLKQGDYKTAYDARKINLPGVPF